MKSEVRFRRMTAHFPMNLFSLVKAVDGCAESLLLIIVRRDLQGSDIMCLYMCVDVM